ncbi:hypothetical protein VDGL01_03875, partial [Verticillium dahliae]
MACGAAPTLTFRNGPLWPLAWVKWAHRQASCLNTARLLQYPEAFIKSLQTYHAVQSFGC